ncbi:MAG: integrase family protein [Anaerocolumna sp.]|jgi:integrase|nr:integrase family protein [Anaerocolumna sp.]
MGLAQVKQEEKIECSIIMFPQDNIIEKKEEDTVKEIKLRLDGTPKIIVRNKKKGQKSEVYPFRTQEDIKNMMNYFIDNKSWHSYLLFVLGINMARRVGDTLNLTWKHFYFPNGRMRSDVLEFEEEKTDKFANPRINNACREAIKLFIEKTEVEPMENYEKPVFMQLSGTGKGKVFSKSGYWVNLKKAAKACNIGYNIAAHSTRKTYGYWSRKLHPNDTDSMQILQSTYNHSSESVTNKYIGLTKEKIDQYYDDMGDFFTEYIMGDKQFQNTENKPIVSLDSNDLRDIITMAYQEGRKNASNNDIDSNLDIVNSIMDLAEELMK